MKWKSTTTETDLMFVPDRKLLKKYEKWCELAETMKIPKRIRNLTTSEASKMIASRTGIQLPFPATFFSVATKKNPDRPLRFLLAYYAFSGIEIDFKDFVLTSEQEEIVLNLHPGMVAVEAGPGTGKTTTIRELIRRHIDDKAKDTGAPLNFLVLAYQNSVVALIRDAICAYPELASSYSVGEFKKRIAIMTIDTLASYLVGSVQLQDFDGNIDRAINALEDETGSVIIREKLISLGQCLCSVIIVDEANMVDDRRGRLIEVIGRKVKRVIGTYVFGDTRQSISNVSGKWFSSLFVKGRANTVVKELSITHRFKTAQMLYLVNRISEGRDLQYEKLVTSTKIDDVEPEHCINVRYLGELEEIVQEIKDYGHKHTFSSIAIITPSLNRENSSSRQVKAFILALNASKIPYGNHGEKNYRSGGVFIGTIHSSSGRQWRRVYLIGFDGFPQNYEHISQRAGSCQLFVALSRASHSITYIIGSRPFNMPLGLDEDLFDDLSDTETQCRIPQFEEPYRKKLSLSFVLERPEASVFFGLNGINVQSKLFARYSVKHIDPYAFIKGITGQEPLQLSKDICLVSQGALLKSIASGRTLYGTTPTKTLVATDSEDPAELFASAFGLQARSSDISVVLASVATLGETFRPSSPVGRKNITVWPHALSTSYVVVLTEDPVYAFLTGFVMGNKRQVVQVSMNGIYKITCDAEKERISHALQSVSEIATFVEILEFRERVLLKEEIAISKRAWTLDTEFLSKGGMPLIYDVALINVKNPFRSIVQQLLIPENHIAEAARAIKVDPQSLQTALTAEEVSDLARSVLRKPTIYNHMSKVDYMWMIDIDREERNVGEDISKRCSKLGAFRGNSKAVNLGDYLSSVGFPPSLEPGLEHSALTDALQLMMLLRLGKLDL